MNLNSKYFDMIRASRDPSGKEKKRAQMVADGTRCDWPDCTKAGDYPAPAGPQANERRNFCYDHVREYNRSYNYFEGMSQDEAERFRRAAQTGHRPTWSMGTRRARGSKVEDWQFQDPLEIMDEAGFSEASPAGPASKVTSGQKRALDVMELPDTAKPADVRKKIQDFGQAISPGRQWRRPFP